MSDLVTVLRPLSRAPAHVAAVVLSLGIGMAVCTAAFSAVNATVFGTTPGIIEPTTLVHLQWDDRAVMTRAEFEAIGQRTQAVFRDVAAQEVSPVPVRFPSGPATVSVGFVSARYFAALGTTALRGRLISAADAIAGAWPVAVISERCWRTKFAGDASVVGRTLRVGGRDFTIAGVAPSGFGGIHLFEMGDDGSSRPQVWVPRASGVSNAATLTVVGRLRPGVALSASRNLLQVIAPSVRRLSSDSERPATLRAFPSRLDWHDRPAMSAASLAVFLIVPLAVLAVGCANVANLQLARASDRARELSIRLTLGASRARVLRLLGAEIVALVVATAVIGLGGSWLLLRYAERTFGRSYPLDPAVLVFTSVLVMFVIAFAGLTPAWLSARDVIAVGLRQDSGSLSRRRIREALVVLQIAVSVLLLFMTVLGVRSLERLLPRHPADAHSRLIARVDLIDRQPEADGAAGFMAAVLQRIEGRGTIDAAGIATFAFDPTPVSYSWPGNAPNEWRTAGGGGVTAGWFNAVGVRVLAGRRLEQSDVRGVAVINSALASALGRTSVLGTRLRVSLERPSSEDIRIVGVVDDPPFAERPMIYLPMPAAPPPSLALVAHARDTRAATAAIKSVVAAIRPSLPCDRIEAMDDGLRVRVQGLNDIVRLAALMAVLVLVLSAVGLYALLAFVVRRRTREIGIRVAVGAAPSAILRLVITQAARLVLSGGVLGLAFAGILAQAMRATLFGLSPVQPTVMVPVVGVLCAVAAAAAALPARHAARIPPMTALRDD